MTFEEFNKLNESEKFKHYEKLSNHDKFLVRMSQDPGVEVIGSYDKEPTKEDKELLNELIKYSNRIIKKDAKK